MPFTEQEVKAIMDEVERKKGIPPGLLDSIRKQIPSAKG